MLHLAKFRYGTRTPENVFIVYQPIFGGLLPANRILAATKFTLHPSLPFSYIASVTAQHSSNGRQPKFVAWYKEWNYRSFAEGATYIWQGGHDVGHRPTFWYFLGRIARTYVDVA